MFDFFSTSVDGLIVLLYIISLVVFFLFGPHKVYESLIGALLGIGLYAFIYIATFVIPDVTAGVPGGGWLIAERGGLLWFANSITVFLCIFAPISIGINVGGVVRGSLWFFFKLIILSAFFTAFVVALSNMMTSGGAIFGQSSLLDAGYLQRSFFTQSDIYPWIVQRTYMILVIASFLAIYKVVFSHWIGRLALIGSVLYVKGNEIFGKKSFDHIGAGVSHDDHSGHDDHADAHDDHGHH